MTAIEVFQQTNGEVTKRFYSELDALGPLGQIATTLFRCQKRSSAAKRYRGGRSKRAAYDVKNWSLGELCRLLSEHAAKLAIAWGWKEDPKQAFHSQVVYVDLPGYGQVSFHSADRVAGPDYPGDWDGKHESEVRIIRFCEDVRQGNIGSLVEPASREMVISRVATPDPVSHALNPKFLTQMRLL